MPLLGSAAMLLAFDVDPAAIAEHDDWHTHEHLPERLSIPGFMRGTRWTALRGNPRYFVMYEVEQLVTLTSKPYLDRLNAPSPWTARMMPHYRGMTRGFCSVVASCGVGMGSIACVVRFEPATATESSTRDAAFVEQLASISGWSGIGSVHWFANALVPEMTTEQRIRGPDASSGETLLLTGYREQALQDVIDSDFMRALRNATGGSGCSVATYRLDYSLTRGDLAA